MVWVGRGGLISVISPYLYLPRTLRKHAESVRSESLTCWADKRHWKYDLSTKPQELCVCVFCACVFVFVFRTGPKF